MPFKKQDEILPRLLNADFEFLEESCTLIESLSLDVEDVRLCLARGFNSSSEHQGVPCLSTMLDFIEHGAYPPYWKYLPESDLKKKQKALDICKAALIKSVVEVSGEERNGDVLWNTSENDGPGGSFVSRMANWIRFYADPQASDGQRDRDDLVICGTLSLGNITRQGNYLLLYICNAHPPSPIRINISGTPLASVFIGSYASIQSFVKSFVGHQDEAWCDWIAKAHCPVETWISCHQFHPQRGQHTSAGS